MRQTMIRAAGLTAVLGLAIGGLVFATSQVKAKAKTIGSINYVKGQASRIRGSKATNVKKGLSLLQGDRIKTGEGSRVEAKLNDGSMLRLGGSSELSLENVSFEKKKKRKVKAKLVIGRVWAAVRGWFGTEDNFEVETQSAVAGVRGTKFTASQAADGTAQVKVYSGKVLVSNRPVYAIKGATKSTRKEVAGPQEVNKKQYMELIAGAMQLIRVAANGDLATGEFEMASAGDDAEWEKWNAERDKAGGMNE